MLQIHGPNIPGSYAILLFTASDLASITSHVHSWVLFLLWLHPFILSGVISPLISSSILGTWGVPLSVSYHFAFSYCSWGSQGKNTEVVCHALLQWTTFCETSPAWPARLGCPHRAWLSFIELDKAVVRVIRLASFLWLWFQCVCPLMPSCNTYHLTWVSLTLDVEVPYSCSNESQSHQWGEVISPDSDRYCKSCDHMHPLVKRFSPTFTSPGKLGCWD